MMVGENRDVATNRIVYFVWYWYYCKQLFSLEKLQKRQVSHHYDSHRDEVAADVAANDDAVEYS